MRVKDKYSWLSMQLMYEWSLQEPTAFNRAKRKHYAFFTSVKDLDTVELKFDEVLRLEKIVELQKRELAPVCYRHR